MEKVPQIIVHTDVVGYKQRRAIMAVNMENVGKISKALTAAIEEYKIEEFKIEVTDQKVEVHMVAVKK